MSDTSPNTMPLTPMTLIRSWAVMSRLDGGQRWHIEHAKDPSVRTLAELAAWGRPKQGQWRGFGKTKVAQWTAILHEAGLEWQGMAPVYPRGNPMYCNVTPLTEEPDDIVHRLQIAHDEEWVSKFPFRERDMLLDAIREIRGLRSVQDSMMKDAAFWSQQYRELMADRDALRKRIDAILDAKAVQS